MKSIPNNLEKYKEDLNNLIDEGKKLSYSLLQECYGDDIIKEIAKTKELDYKDFINSLKPFSSYYQSWYSESLILLKQLLPYRLDDFKKLYESSKTRKSLKNDNYVIEDFLHVVELSNNFDYLDNSTNYRKATINKFEQQRAIIKSVKRRFESTLFDIRQLTQADLFDSELDAAIELNKKGFVRGAGAIAGVVLEKHLAQVCNNHKIKISKKKPTISDFNDNLKNAEIIEIAEWRKIQHLGDIRNRCDHNKNKEPTKEDVEELIEGVNRTIKNLW